MTVDNMEKLKTKKRQPEESDEKPKLKIKKLKKSKNEKDIVEENPSTENHPSTPKAKKPKSILKVKNKKTKASSPKTPLTDVDDDISAEVLEQLAVNEDEAPQTNPSFQPRPDDGVSGGEKDDSVAASASKLKKEKMRKKKEKKRAIKATAQEAKTNSDGDEIRILEAKEYLRLWKHDKESWKFNKNRQTWLLKNMFHKDALEDSSFSILVEYLRPLKGNAREETVKRAEAKVNEDGVDFLQAERARVIVQMLS